MQSHFKAQETIKTLRQQGSCAGSTMHWFWAPQRYYLAILRWRSVALACSHLTEPARLLTQLGMGE